MVLQRKLGGGTMNEYNHETVEWGIRRKTLYERQRDALREMEEMKDGNKQRSSSETRERSDQM